MAGLVPAIHAMMLRNPWSAKRITVADTPWDAATSAGMTRGRATRQERTYPLPVRAISTLCCMRRTISRIR